MSISDGSGPDELKERREFVKDSYEHLWEAVYEKAAETLASGERDLGRVHLATRRNFGPSFSDPVLRKKYVDQEQKKLIDGYILDKQIVKVHDLDPRITTLITDAVKMREIINEMDPETERIVELGAGWAKTLLNIWRFGGPKDAEYWALELTKAGRRTTEMIVEHCAPTMKIRTAAFDYYDNDFSALGTDAKRTCVVTHHSLEQIPQMDPGLIEAILAIPGFDRCVHIEPVGWQIPTNNWLEFDGRGDPKIHLKRMKKIDDGNRDFSEKKNQNRNLYPVLRDFEKKGVIRMRVVRKYLVSHRIRNATTLISWEKGNGVIPDEQLVHDRRDDLNPDFSVTDREAA